MALDVRVSQRESFVLAYSLLLGLAAITLFLYGFFPIRYPSKNVAEMNDVPHRVEHVSVKADELYRPVVKKVIIMIIDALRWDFVTGPVGKSAMPVTSRLLRENRTCLMQAKSDPPTVTMPRIKAMMTGAVPGFADVALNFGDLPASGDSLPLQAKNHGHPVHFYGDDTWLKIFPGVFERHEGTTSFFVSDFTEVDNNVTRNLSGELEDKDSWSMLILHYLGLDHIGHVAGPFSPLINPKLREMDDVIGRIEAKIRDWNENGLPTIFVICGDHGMKDSGGHGGSSPEEMLVPFLVIGANCDSKDDQPNRISQVDVAPTLAVMLGTPIPSSNVGSVPPIMLNGRSNSSKLFVLYYNAQQVLKHFKIVSGWEAHQAYADYKDAVALHVHWLTNHGESNAVAEALILYDKALRSMKELLIRSAIDYDLHAMTVAMIFMAHVVYILIGEIGDPGGRLKKLCWIIGSILSYILLRYLWEQETITSQTNTNFPLTAIALGILAFNSNLVENVSLKFLKRPISKIEWQQCLLPLATLVHTMSLASSSFVEEEHQTWYFFWATLLVLLCLNAMRKSCDVTSTASRSLNARLGIEIFLVLVTHRVLRKLNSTGNKYASAPDIAKWLRDREDNTALTIFLLIASASFTLIPFVCQGLGLLVSIGHAFDDNKHKVKTLLIHGGTAICVYLRHMAKGSVAKLPFDFGSRGIIEVRIFWMIAIIHILFCAHRLRGTMENNLRARLFLRFTLEQWIMISAILHRPHNVVLLPMQVLCSIVVHRALGAGAGREYAIPYGYVWMGNVFYFYQGNSNSLATVDVAAGYVGMESYSPVVATAFMSINTYSAPVLAYLSLLYRSTLGEQSNAYSERILSINRYCALWRFLPVAVYAVIVTIQRFHLFVWSVFSPKVFFEAMHCAVIFTLIVTIQIVFFCMRLK